MIYFEAFGETKQQLLKLLKRRGPALDAMVKFAKQYGTEEIVFFNCFTAWFGLSFNTLEIPKKMQKLWRQHSRMRGVLVPRCSTKEGKALQQRMNELAQAMPTTLDVAKVLKLEIFGDDFPNIRGGHVVRVGKRVLAYTSNTRYKPRKSVSLKRISDLVFDKLTKGGKAKAKDYI